MRNTARRRFATIRGERLYAPGTGLQEALYFWIFPNLTLNIYPDNVSTNLILSISQEKTLRVFECFSMMRNRSGNRSVN